MGIGNDSVSANIVDSTKRLIRLFVILLSGVDCNTPVNSYLYLAFHVMSQSFTVTVVTC